MEKDISSKPNFPITANNEELYDLRNPPEGGGFLVWWRWGELPAFFRRGAGCAGREPVLCEKIEEFTSVRAGSCTCRRHVRF